MKIFTTYRKKLLIILCWLGIWEGLSWLIGYDIILPGPVNTLIVLLALLKNSAFWSAVFSSILKIASGFILALFTGVFLGALTSISHWLYEIVHVPMAVIKAVPVASYTILAVFWINSKYLALFISFIMVLPLIYYSIYEGIKNTDKELLQMSDSFEFSWYRKIMAIYLPQVIPYAEASMSSAAGIAWKSGIAAELIVLVNNSIGGKMYSAKVLMNMPEVFAWTTVVVFLNFLMEKLLERAVMRLKKCQFI